MTSRIGWSQSLRYLFCLVLLGLLLARSAHSATINKEVASGGGYPVYDEPEETRIGGYCGVTRLFANRTEFDMRCDPKTSDPKWPCFTHSSGSLISTRIEPWLEPIDMSQKLILRDAGASSFTLRNPSNSFVIHYVPGDPAITFRYYDYEPQTGCYKIHLSSVPPFRLFVSDGIGNDRDIDTRHYYETGKRLCSKWITIDYTTDLEDDTDQKESDGRGI